MKPTMIYGTAWKKDKTAALVELAIGQGFRAIDTACQPKHYNEKLVGVGVQRALAQNNLTREALFLQTKFTPLSGQDPDNTPYNPADPIEKQIKTSLAVSKANLQADYLDSLILHSPIFPFGELEKAWRVFEGFVADGDVRQIGISNCYDIDLFKKLYEVAAIKPKVLQNRFYDGSSYDKKLRAFCKESEISYQSFWSLSANPHLLGSKEVLKLSVKYQKTAPVIFYRFLTQIGVTPLNGTTSATHMREDLEILSFALEGDEIESINSLL
jgi:diketogulonate reductase-like aldo/keto reductase